MAFVAAGRCKEALKMSSMLRRGLVILFCLKLAVLSAFAGVSAHGGKDG